MLLLQNRATISSHQLYNESQKMDFSNSIKTRDEVASIIEQKILGDSHFVVNSTGGREVLSTVVTAAGLPFFAQTQNIGIGFSQLKDSVIQRGTTYAKNTLASRRGYVAENFIAESYNLDAKIKKSDDYAYVPESNKDASPDIVYDYDSKEASLKFYKDSEQSAKAQTNPKYENQTRVIPEDQVDEAKEFLDKLAKKNEMKGRDEASQLQRQTAEKIDSKIKGRDGVESTELTKKQSDELAEAFTVDENGNTIVDESKIDKVLKETGIETKVRRAKLMNELKGIGIAAAIGFGVGITITAVMELASSGIEAANFDRIMTNSFFAGVESGVLSIASYGINKLTSNVLNSSFGVNLLTDFGYTLNFAAAGLISIAVFSTYQFIKMKLAGVDTGKALSVVGRQAMFSLSVLAVSVIAQGIYGGAAGIIVSTSIGLIYMAYNVAETVHQRKMAERIREYTIEQYRPLLLGGVI